MIADPHAPECPCARCKGPAWRHMQQDAKDRQRRQKVMVSNSASPHTEADLMRVQRALDAEMAAALFPVEQALAAEDTAFERWVAADTTDTFQEWQESRLPAAKIGQWYGHLSTMLPGQITMIAASATTKADTVTDSSIADATF